MILVRPLLVTPEMLVASNILEDDAPEWSAATTYAEAQEVLFQHRVYESLIADNLGNQPDTGVLADPPTWLDLGPANRYRMFDASPSTTSQRASQIQFTVAPGRPLNAVGLCNVRGISALVERLDASDTVVWAQTRPLLDADPQGNGQADYLTDIVFLNLPLTADRVRITISAPGSTAKCGACLIGRTALLGDTLFGSTIGIRDYSRKEVDEFGVTRIVKRGYAKTADFSLVLDTVRLSAVQRQLAQVRAEPALFVGISTRDVTIVYGFFRSFQLVISGPVRSTASIEAESLTYEGDDALFPAASVNTPSITSPAANTTVPANTTLTSSVFGTIPENVDSHAKTDWQVLNASGKVHHQSLDDRVNKTAYTIPNGVLFPGSTYKARVRYQGASLGPSPWSVEVPFVAGAQQTSVNAPTITSPNNDNADHGEGSPFASSAFSTSASADTHQSSDWQIAPSPDFTSVVVESLGDTVNRTSWAAPLGSLTLGSSYYLRTRHRGLQFGASPWSAPRRFRAVSFYGSLGKSYSVLTSRQGPCGASIAVSFAANGSWQVAMPAVGTAFRFKNEQSFSGVSDNGTWSITPADPSGYEISLAVVSGAGGAGVGAGTGGFVPFPATFSIEAQSGGASAFVGCTLEVRIRGLSNPASEIVKRIDLQAAATNQQ